MKRHLMIALLALTAVGASAQDWSFSGGKSYETKRNNIGIELGVGGTGDVTVDLGVKWQMNLHENVAWDVLSLKAMADVENNLGESLTATLMTGPRFLSPEFAGIRVYANARCGYAFNFDASKGGFAFEVGGGLQVTRSIYVGYAYTNFKYSYDEDDDSWGYGESYDVKCRYHAFRIGFLF